MGKTFDVDSGRKKAKGNVYTDARSRWQKPLGQHDNSRDSAAFDQSAQEEMPDRVISVKSLQERLQKPHKYKRLYLRGKTITGDLFRLTDDELGQLHFGGANLVHANLGNMLQKNKHLFRFDETTLFNEAIADYFIDWVIEQRGFRPLTTHTPLQVKEFHCNGRNGVDLD